MNERLKKLADNLALFGTILIEVVLAAVLFFAIITVAHWLEAWLKQLQGPVTVAHPCLSQISPQFAQTLLTVIDHAAITGSDAPAVLQLRQILQAAAQGGGEPPSFIFVIGKAGEIVLLGVDCMIGLFFVSRGLYRAWQESWGVVFSKRRQ